MFAGAGRESLRGAWRDAWRRFRAGLPLGPLEGQLADIVALHPEYQPILEDDEAALGRDWIPGQGEDNPFLHMGLHAAVRDGVATDRPPGVRQAYESALGLTGSPHEAEHLLLGCLEETLWEAQCGGGPPDGQAWLERVRSRLPRR